MSARDGWRLGARARWVTVASVGAMALLLLLGAALRSAVEAGESRAAARAGLGGFHTHVVEQPVRQGQLTVVGVPAEAELAVGGSSITGDTSVLAEGEMLVSPELARELTDDPFLRSRLPWRHAGTLGRDALRVPDELVAVVGQPASNATGGMHDHLPGDSHPSSTGRGLAVGLILLAVSVQSVVLIGAAYQFQFSRGNRKGGQLPGTGQPGRLFSPAVVEGLVVAIPALAVAVAVAVLVRTVAAGVFGFYPQDVWLSSPMTIVVIACVALVAIFGARHGLRQVESSAVSAPAAVEPASPWRLLLLLVGIGAGIFVVGLDPSTERSAGLLSPNEAIAGVVLVGGLVLSAPALIRLIAQTWQRRKVGAGRLLGLRRIDLFPQTAFRGLGLLSIAVFLFTYLAIFGADGSESSQSSLADIVVELEGVTPGPMLDALAGVDGVRSVAPIAYEPSSQGPNDPMLVTTCDGLPALGVTVEEGACRPGYVLTQGERAPAASQGAPGGTDRPPEASTRVSGSFTAASGTFTQLLALPESDFDERPLSGVHVLTDGRTASIEEAAAAIARAKPLALFGPDRLNQPGRSLGDLTGSMRVLLLTVTLLALSATLLTVATSMHERRDEIARAGLSGRQRKQWIATEVSVPFAAAVIPPMLAAIAIGIGSKLALGDEITLDLARVEIVLPLVVAALASAVAIALLARSEAASPTIRRVAPDSGTQGPAAVLPEPAVDVSP